MAFTCDQDSRNLGTEYIRAERWLRGPQFLRGRLKERRIGPGAHVTGGHMANTFEPSFQGEAGKGDC